MLVGVINIIGRPDAVFLLNMVWYCDETTIALTGFLKVRQVSESSECKAKPRRTH